MPTSKPIPNTPTTASFPSGSESQLSMNPSLPGDRVIDVSDAPAAGSYPFSFKFSGLASTGNVNAPQPPTSVPGTIGGTSNSVNDAGASNDFGGATIGANEQVEAIPSTQMSRPRFDFGMAGGQSTRMDTRTHKNSVPVPGTDAGSSAVDTMQYTSSSLFNALG